MRAWKDKIGLTRLLHDSSFSFRESDVTSGLVLYKLNFDLPPTRFLVRLWLLFFIVVVAAALYRVVVLNKRVVSGCHHRGRAWVNGLQALSLG